MANNERVNAEHGDFLRGLQDRIAAHNLVLPHT